jgi:L,D-transpeptidase ErfK/SrfK
VAPAVFAAGVLVLGQAAVAAPGLDVYASLLPGRLTGGMTAYTVKKGDTVTAISTRFTVHPIRVYKPNREALKDGLEYNETLYIDQRRITPRFRPDVRGIVLNIPEAQVYLVEKGQLVSEYPVAVSTTDRPAPLGRTRVVGKTKHPTWHVPASIQKEMGEKGLEVKTQVPPGPENPLGSRWIGWADGTFGFHGTLVPSSIKRYASHGCVRFLRPHIEDLYDRVSVGTPVRVLYQPVLLAVDVKAIWLSVYPDVYETDYDFKGTVSTLARQAGVSGRIHWPSVEKAIQAADGIVVDVAIGSVASPKPKPAATARPTATPRPTPAATPTAAPSAEPTPAEPSVAPFEEPAPSETP